MALASTLDESWGIQPRVDGGEIIEGTGGARSCKGGDSIHPEKIREGTSFAVATQSPNRDCIKNNAKHVKLGSISSVAFKQQAAASGGMHVAFTLNGDGPFMHALGQLP
jgi:hypothetical protein